MIKKLHTIIIILILFLIIRLYPSNDNTICGITHNNIIGYCNNNSLSKNYINNIYTGQKWQCIEFIRRYFIIIHNLTFQSVHNAYDMINIKYMTHINTYTKYYCTFYTKNSSTPKKNDILLFRYGSDGHVAIVINIINNTLQIAEQNWDSLKWKGTNYSRDINIDDTSIIGWIHVNNLFSRTKY